MHQLVCITGLTGAGKSIASDFFVKKGFQYLRFGQIVLDEIQKKGMEVNEANERYVREDLRKKYGMAAMAKLNLPKFRQLLKKGDVIGDGLYSFEEYKFLKKEFPNKLITITIYSPPKIRYIRVAKRKRVSDDKAAKNRPLTAKEAKSRDYAEIENLNKGGTIALSDYTIVNIKSLQYFYKQLNEVLKEIKKAK
jgi:dephospho-CoA kinase